ncbi:ATP-binding cassette domain-containing protein, partial [Actinomyces sp. AC-18-1]|nr:ATP-binding cassette domain-containing protein [Actinomyces sp. 187325]
MVGTRWAQCTGGRAAARGGADGRDPLLRRACQDRFDGVTEKDENRFHARPHLPSPPPPRRRRRPRPRRLAGRLRWSLLHLLRRRRPGRLGLLLPHPVPRRGHRRRRRQRHQRHPRQRRAARLRARSRGRRRPGEGGPRGLRLRLPGLPGRGPGPGRRPHRPRHRRRRRPRPPRGGRARPRGRGRGPRPRGRGRRPRPRARRRGRPALLARPRAHGRRRGRHRGRPGEGGPRQRLHLPGGPGRARHHPQRHRRGLHQRAGQLRAHHLHHLPRRLRLPRGPLRAHPGLRLRRGPRGRAQPRGPRRRQGGRPRHRHDDGLHRGARLPRDRPGPGRRDRRHHRRPVPHGVPARGRGLRRGHERQPRGPAHRARLQVTGQEHPVQAEGVCVVLGDSLVLDGVDLLVRAGESVALLGANGSGKSTLVRTVLGLLPVASGTVRLFGADVTSRRDVAWDRVGYVPQRIGSASGVPATALEVVRSGLLGPRRPLADRGRRAREAAMSALDAVGLAHRAEDHVQVFSGGQMQRVLIARALVRRPELLLLDEPLAGIDRASRESLAQILTGLRRSGLTLVTVLHEMGELAQVVERAVVLDEGRVVLDAPASRLGEDPHALRTALAHRSDDGHDHPHPAAPVAHHAPV